MNNIMYKLNRCESQERGRHPWLKTKHASVNRYGMELVNAKKRKGK